MSDRISGSVITLKEGSGVRILISQSERDTSVAMSLINGALKTTYSFEKSGCYDYEARSGDRFTVVKELVSGSFRERCCVREDRIAITPSPAGGRVLASGATDIAKNFTLQFLSRLLVALLVATLLSALPMGLG